MRSEHILLTTLALLNLTMIGVVYFEAKDPSVHRWEVQAPDEIQWPVNLLMPAPEGFF